ncbi:proteophosphoglycan related [Cyclospora cayetanensis]|uniref:Fanconi-associated nuclease n=1 Tax=Cyclospora cayetanensis TaxID=88456 RepID=A0A1D3CTL1_9EIME|nr:proteophosphoglycan related [Cyclospora cayetanensis]
MPWRSRRASSSSSGPPGSAHNGGSRGRACQSSLKDFFCSRPQARNEGGAGRVSLETTEIPRGASQQPPALVIDLTEGEPQASELEGHSSALKSQYLNEVQQAASSEPGKRILPWKKPPATAAKNDAVATAAAPADPVAIACAAAGIPVAAVSSRPLQTLRFCLPLRLCVAAAVGHLQHLLLPLELRCIRRLAQLLGLPAAAAATSSHKAETAEPSPEAPTEATREGATETPTEAAREAATETPTEAAREAATETPTEAAREAATETPTEAAREAATHLALDGGPEEVVLEALSPGGQLLLSRIVLHLLRLSVSPDLPIAAIRRVRNSSGACGCQWLRVPQLLRVARELPHAACALRELKDRGLLVLWVPQSVPPTAAGAAENAETLCGHCVVSVDGVCACAWSSALLCLSAAELKGIAEEALEALGPFRDSWSPTAKPRTRKETLAFLQDLQLRRLPRHVLQQRPQQPTQICASQVDGVQQQQAEDAPHKADEQQTGSTDSCSSTFSPCVYLNVGGCSSNSCSASSGSCRVRCRVLATAEGEASEGPIVSVADRPGGAATGGAAETAAGTGDGGLAAEFPTNRLCLLPVWHCSCCSCVHQRVFGAAAEATATGSRQQLTEYAAALLAELRMAFAVSDAGKPAGSGDAAAEGEALQLAAAAERYLCTHIREKEKALKEGCAAAADAASSSSSAIATVNRRDSKDKNSKGCCIGCAEGSACGVSPGASVEAAGGVAGTDSETYNHSSSQQPPSQPTPERQQQIGVYRHRIGKWFNRLTVLLLQHLKQHQRAVVQAVRCLREGCAIRKADRHEEGAEERVLCVWLLSGEAAEGIGHFREEGYDQQTPVHALVKTAVAAVYGQPIRGVCWVWKALADGGYTMADDDQQQEPTPKHRWREGAKGCQDHVEGGAIGGPSLAVIFGLFEEDFRSWSSGLPDLILWRPKQQQLIQQLEQHLQQPAMPEEERPEQQQQMRQYGQQKDDGVAQGEHTELEVMFVEVLACAAAGGRHLMPDLQGCRATGCTADAATAEQRGKPQEGPSTESEAGGRHTSKQEEEGSKGCGGKAPASKAFESRAARAFTAA